jgi:outer membrane receptor for ferrienterochelin and colicins
VGGQWKRLTGYLNAEHHQRDGYSLIPHDPATVGADTDHQDLFLKLRYNFTPAASLGFTSSSAWNHQQGLGTTAGIDPSDPSHFTSTPTALRSNDDTRTYTLVGDFVPTSSTTVQARVYSSSYGESSNSRLIDGASEGPAFDIGTLNEDYRRADVTIGQPWGRFQFLQAGYEGVHDTYRGDNRIVGGSAGQALNTNDLWIQDRIEPFKNLVLTLGGRYQHNSSYGGHVVPKAGVVYRVNDHVTTRAAYGQGFRAPNLGELYYHLLHLEYGYQVIGNPTLEPETSRSYSGGGTFTAGRYELSVNLFRNDLRNLINYVSVCDATMGEDCSGAALNDRMAQYGVPPSFDYDASGAAFFTFVNLNVDRAMTQGMDLDGRVTLAPSLTFSGAYMYLDAKDTVVQTPLPYRSHHQGHVKLEYADAHMGFVTNIRGSFFGRWPTGSETGDPVNDYSYGYQIWNLYASQAVGHGARLFAAIDNLGDSRDRKLTLHQPTFDRPDYGRTFRLGLRYTFAE